MSWKGSNYHFWSWNASVLLPSWPLAVLVACRQGLATGKCTGGHAGAPWWWWRLQRDTNWGNWCWRWIIGWIMGWIIGWIMRISWMNAESCGSWFMRKIMRLKVVFGHWCHKLCGQQWLGNMAKFLQAPCACAGCVSVLRLVLRYSVLCYWELLVLCVVTTENQIREQNTASLARVVMDCRILLDVCSGQHRPFRS